MDMPNGGDITLGMKALGYFGLSGFGIWFLSKIIPQFTAARTEAVADGAQSTLITGLISRIDALEKAQSDAMKEFDEERKRRLDAESQVAALTTRISRLEQQLRDLGHDPK